MDHAGGTSSVVQAAESARVVIEASATGGAFGLVELSGTFGAGPPRHRHADEDEILYVVRGAADIEREGTITHQPAGGCVFLPRGSEHTYRVTSPTAVLLMVVTPGGVEASFRNGVWDGAHLERLIATAAGVGIEITGAPLSG